MRALLFDMCRRYNLCGKMQPLAKIVESFRSKSVVIPLPGELSLKVAARGQRLACFNDLQKKSTGDQLIEIV